LASACGSGRSPARRRLRRRYRRERGCAGSGAALYEIAVFHTLGRPGRSAGIPGSLGTARGGRGAGAGRPRRHRALLGPASCSESRLRSAGGAGLCTPGPEQRRGARWGCRCAVKLKRSLPHAGTSSRLFSRSGVTFTFVASGDQALQQS